MFSCSWCLVLLFSLFFTSFCKNSYRCLFKSANTTVSSAYLMLQQRPPIMNPDRTNTPQIVSFYRFNNPAGRHHFFSFLSISVYFLNLFYYPYLGEFTPSIVFGQFPNILRKYFKVTLIFQLSFDSEDMGETKLHFCNFSHCINSFYFISDSFYLLYFL